MALLGLLEVFANRVGKICPNKPKLVEAVWFLGLYAVVTGSVPMRGVVTAAKEEK